MSKTKHSPGPWAAMPAQFNHGETTVIVDRDSNIIAHMEGQSFPHTEHDAALFAAALELLIALDRAVQDIDSGWAEDANERFPWLEAARAAIAKADGEAPVTHLLKPRGGNQCGKAGASTAEINNVTCDDCISQHAAICEAQEED